ncbi:MAG: hypothetical protein KatS3mg016_0636 [Fimbriimonadales bacterium]|nr:MAG: hypothetical protein KatS3mg016_0636 [Fimbriimonadales bacterium]
MHTLAHFRDGMISALKKGCVRVLSVVLLYAGLSLPSHAQIWGVKAPDSGWNTPRRWLLFWFHEDGSEITFVGDIQGATKVDGLALSPQHGLLAFQNDGDLYRDTGNNARLVRIDPATLQATVIGSWLAGRSIHGAAFDLQGRLWAVDVRQGELLQIDPTNGNIITSVPLSYQGNRLYPSHATDIAFDRYGVAYLSDYIPSPPYGAKYYQVDMQTGVLTLLHTDTQRVPGPESAGPGVVGLAFSMRAPADRLFIFNDNGYDNIWYYDMNSGWTRVYMYDVLSSYVSGGYNSGPGDLASVMQCASSNGDANNDGCVDDADMLQVLFAFGSTGPNDADVNCDGMTDDADLLIVLFHFGNGC